MPNPKKQFKKEDVLKWYQSFINSLSEVGIDINNPASLMRIKSYDFKPAKDNDMGNKADDNGEKNFAFIPKNFSTETGENIGYQKAMPIANSEYAEVELQNQYEGMHNAYNTYLDKMTALSRAYDNNDADGIKTNEEALKTAQLNDKVCFDSFRRSYNETYPEYLKWMLGNQKLFNAETDYDQIEELYSKALEGLLYVNFPDKNVEDSWQIAVTNDGQSTYSKVNDDAEAPDLSVRQLARYINNIKNNTQELSEKIQGTQAKVAEALKKYETEIGHPINYDGEKMLSNFTNKKPAEVPKPGFKSWMKRIFTFGRNKEDFTRYDQYRQDLSAYDQAKQAHKEKTERQYSDMLKFAERYKDEIGIAGPKNIKNASLVEDNRMRMNGAEYDTEDPDPKKGQFTTSFHKMQKRMEHMLENQVTMAPDSVNPDGSFNKAKTDAFWKEHGHIVPPEHGNKEAKVHRKFVEAKSKFIVRVAKEIENNKDAQELYNEIIKKEKPGVERNISHKERAAESNKFNKEVELENEMLDILGQASALGFTDDQTKRIAMNIGKQSFDSQVKKIGALFTDDPKEAFHTGISALGVAYTRCIETNPDGSQKDYAHLRTSTEIYDEIGKLIEASNNPEKLKEHKAIVDEIKTVMDMSVKNNQAPRLEDCAKGFEEVLYYDQVINGVDFTDVSKMSPATALTCELFFKFQTGMKKDISELPEHQQDIFEAGESLCQISRITPKYNKALAAYEANKKQSEKEYNKEVYGSELPEINPKQINKGFELGL